MICKNCGKEVLEGSKFCTYCGMQFEEYHADIVQKEEEVKEAELKDDFTITSYHIKGRTILKVLTLLLIVFFWCPMFMVSCGNINTINISLDDVAEGINSLEPVYGIWLFLALPILSFVSLFSKKGREDDGPFSAAAGGTSAIMLVMTYISAQQRLKGTEYNIVLHKLLTQTSHTIWCIKP